MELTVWVESQPRLISGITDATTCQDIIFALAHATNKTGKFSLVEKWRTSERSLSPQDQPIKLLSKWGEYASDVQFILRCVDGSPEGPVKPPRHYADPQQLIAEAQNLSFNDGNPSAKPFFVSATSPMPESGTLLKTSGRETPRALVARGTVGLMRSRTEDLKFGSVAAANTSGFLNQSAASNNSSSVFGGTDNLSGSFDQSFNSHEYNDSGRGIQQPKKPSRPPPSYDVAMRRRNQSAGAGGFHPQSQRSRSLEDLSKIAKNQEVILMDQSQRLVVLGQELNAMESRERQTISEIERMSKEIQLLEAREKPIRRDISNLQSLFGTAEVLQNQLDSSRAQLVQTAEEKVTLRKRIAEADNLADLKQHEIQLLSSELREVLGQTAVLDKQFDVEIDRLQAELLAVTSENDSIEASLVRTSDEISKYEAIANQKKQMLADLSKKIKEANLQDLLDVQDANDESPSTSDTSREEERQTGKTKKGLWV